MRLPFSPLTRRLAEFGTKMLRHDTTAPVIACRLQHPVQQAHRRRWSAATTTEESAFAGGKDALRPPWATGLRDSPRISTRCGGAFWPNRHGTLHGFPEFECQPVGVSASHVRVVEICTTFRRVSETLPSLSGAPIGHDVAGCVRPARPPGWCRQEAPISAWLRS